MTTLTAEPSWLRRHLSDALFVLRAARLFARVRFDTWRRGEPRRPPAFDGDDAPLPPYGSTVEVDGIVMRIDERMSAYNIRKLVAGRHTFQERALMRALLRPDDVVMELGGGIGMVAIECARLIGSERVFAYEANPEIENLARDNYALNDVAPTLTAAMLGREAGRRTFHLAERFSRSSAHVAEPGTRPVEVPVLALGDELARTGATVLVIDIQGGEVELTEFADLSGLRAVMIEMHPFLIGLSGMRKVRRRLRRAGLAEAARDGQCYLFVRPGR